MSMFNMGAVKGTQVSGTTNYLRAGIHDVIFKGLDKIEGAESMEIRFESADGAIHNERVFSPRSSERTMSQFGTNPSESEQFMCKIKQVISALDPDLAKKIDEKGETFAAPDFASFVKLLKKYLDPKIGTETQIKLLPTSGNYVGFPAYPARINKDGDLYMTTKFIGNDLVLTPKETTLVEAAKNAKPTAMNNTTTPTDELADLQQDFPVDQSNDDDLPF